MKDCLTILNLYPEPNLLHFTLSTMDSSSPYRSHPIFTFRVALLANAAVGLFLTTFTAVDGYISFHSLFAFIIMLFIFTIAMCCYDLVEWAINKSHATESYKWPLKVVLLADLVLVSLFIVVYVKEVINLNRYLNWVDVGIITTYSTLPPLLAAVLHGFCLWKQLGLKNKVATWRIPVSFGNRAGRIRLEGEEETISAGA
jgi:hypothetical protein